MDRELWRVENFPSFLEARKTLLAAEVNKRMEELLHGDTRWLSGPSAPSPTPSTVLGGITSEDEEQELEAVNAWMQENGLPEGVIAFDFSDTETGQQKAIFDLAWPNGIQEELSQPVALLLNEGSDVLAIASQAGYRCFVSADDLRRYVRSEILAEDIAA